MDLKLKPFVKWVGGKRDVIKKYLQFYLPKTYGNYYEIFAGGSAMLYHLLPNQAIINDINEDLIITYQVIKDQLEQLIAKLDEHQSKHSIAYYYQIRKLVVSDPVERAARFIYLNKTCYNGLWRVNKKNQFNVPANGKENVVLYEKTNLFHLNQYFNTRKIKFTNCSFQEWFLKYGQDLKTGDFVFVDPPYDYEVGQRGFTSYSQSGFNQVQQQELSAYLKQLDQRGIMWMHTNHDTKLIRNLYQDFTMIECLTNRAINRDGNKRKNGAREVIIVNYPINKATKGVNLD